MRARWPHSIVTWNRVLAGRWLDPQVGSHFLIGAAVGSVIWVAGTVVQTWADKENNLGPGPSLFAQGTRQWIAGHANTFSAALNIGLFGFFAIFGIRRAVRRDAVAAVVAALLFSAMEQQVVNSPNWPLMLAIFVAIFFVLIYILLRVGLVATIVSVFFINSYGAITLGTNWNTWFAPYGIATLLLLNGIACFAFWRSLGDRSLLGDSPDAV